MTVLFFYQLPNVQPPPYDSNPAAPLIPNAAPVQASVGGRKLVFIGVRNYVICRDMQNPAGVVELWRRKMGCSSWLVRNETQVVFSGGLVVARFTTKLAGLDPSTGTVRWAFDMESEGYSGILTLLATPNVVYVSGKTAVYAISSANGHTLWSYPVKSCVPAVLLCGVRVVIVASNKIVCLNASNGLLLWVTQARGIIISSAPSVAWDGGDRLFVGSRGYISCFRLSNGTQDGNINLKGTGYHPVNLAFDSTRQVFYAMCKGKLFAISNGYNNRILWVCKTPSSVLSATYSCMSLDPLSGRIYTVMNKRFSCVDSNGNIVFTKKFSKSAPSSCLYSICVDPQGTGKIFVGCGGHYIVYDCNGNEIATDNLPGMRYGSVMLCTETSSSDPNASGLAFNTYHAEKAKMDCAFTTFYCAFLVFFILII